jgi:Amt family ammonium transporter
VICYLAIQMKNRLGYDDTLDVFGIHGVAGIVGAIGLTFFLREVPKHGIGTQLWFQIKGVLVSMIISGVATLILLVLVQKTVGLRMDEEDEAIGMDGALHGERGYNIGN